MSKNKYNPTGKKEEKESMDKTSQTLLITLVVVFVLALIFIKVFM